jgi:hypothetical protein
MHDRVNLIEKFRRKLPNIAKHLAIQNRFREKACAGKVVAKEPRVKTYQLGVYEIFTKEPCEDGADISHIARNQNAHSSSLQIPSPPRLGRAAGN